MSGKGKARPRKGQRVSFKRADGQSSARRSDAVTGLRFTVDTAHGGTALIELVVLRPRRLALAFGSALRELAPTMVRSTVLQHLNGLKRFFVFLNETAPTIDGPEHLRAEHIDGFESWLEAQGVTTIHRHTIIAKAIIALRTIDAGRPGLLDEKLRQRLGYTSARSLGRSTPRDAYSGYVAKQLRDAARADIQAITRRLKSPAPIEHADATLRGHLEAAAEVIEAEGTIGHTHPVLLSFYRRFHLLGLENGTPIRDLHARRHLLAEDVIPFFVLLSLETGLEPECVKALRLDCLRNPASGTVEIDYVKRRARGSEWKRLAKTLFVGVLSDCFFDPATALCLNGKTDHSRPAMAQCRPDRCPNSCITDRHRPLWAKAITDGEELLKTRRLSPLQREAIDADITKYRKAIRVF